MLATSLASSRPEKPSVAAAASCMSSGVDALGLDGVWPPGAPPQQRPQPARNARLSPRASTPCAADILKAREETAL